MSDAFNTVFGDAIVAVQSIKLPRRRANGKAGNRTESTTVAPSHSQPISDDATVAPQPRMTARRRTKETANCEPETTLVPPSPSPIAEPASGRRRKANRAATPTRASPSANPFETALHTSSETQNRGERADAGGLGRSETQQIGAACVTNQEPAVKRRKTARVGAKPNDVAPSSTNPDGQYARETHAKPAIGCDDGSHIHIETQSAGAPVVAEIRSLWRMRQRWHRAEKALILQGKAICRAFCDGDKEAGSKAFDDAAAGKNVSLEILAALSPFLPAIERFEGERMAIEKRMKKIAKGLPAYGWMKSVKGFGELNYVALVGECGDIGGYKSVSAVWKRMGLAVISGERQRKCADAEMALEHGYNPSRRSVAFNLGECLIKASSPFKDAYNERKSFEIARDPEMRPIHAHRRAARYMVKRVLRTLYAEWRKDTGLPNAEA